MQYTWLLVIIYGGKARYYGERGRGYANHWSKLWRFYFIVLGLNEIPWYLVWKKWYKAIKSIKMYVKIRLFIYNFKSPNLNGTINLEWPPSLQNHASHSCLRASAILSPCPAFWSPFAVFFFIYFSWLNQPKLKIYLFIVLLNFETRWKVSKQFSKEDRG